MNIRIFTLVFSGLLLAAPHYLEAQSSKQKNSKTTSKAKTQAKSPKGRSTPAGRKKTVGELLSQAQQESRGGGSKVNIERGRTALPKSQLSFKAPVTPVNLEQVKPAPSSIFVSSKDDESGLAQYERAQERQMQEMFKMTKKFANSPNRGEYWLRLAELYVERASIVNSKIQADYDRRLVAYNQGKSKSKPQLNNKAAQDYNKKAIQLYEWFVRDFPNDPKISQAFYFLGFNFFELGQPEKGAKYYRLLIEKYPKSPFAGEAYFGLAEYDFDNDKWSEAYKNYSFLIKDKRHKLHTFSLYKGAWCLFRLGKHKDALNYMEYILRAGRSDQGSELASKRVINRTKLEAEALRDIVVFYVHVRDAQDAMAYFKRIVPGDPLPYIERLAYFYADSRGDRASARLLFTQLIEANPTAPKAFEYQYQIVQNYFYAKNSPLFKQELFKWIREFNKESPWGKANAANETLLADGYKLQEQLLRNYILQNHQNAQDSRGTFSQGLASEGYNIYLREFKESPVIGDMHFYYAELLFDMKKFDQAAIHYRWVVDNAPQSKFFDKAATNLLLAFEKSVPSEKELAKRNEEDLNPIPMNPNTQKFVETAEWFTAKFPKAEKSTEIKFRAGRLYYLHNQFDKAEAIFKNIVQTSPRSKQAEFSANLLLDIYNLKKDYIGLEKAGEELLQNPAFASTKAGEEIKGVIERANFKKAQDLETQKKFLESAQQYEAFATQNPKSTLALTATFNAGVNYERAGQSTASLRNFNKVIASTDPESAKLKPKIRRVMAKLYQDVGRFEEAAKLFRELAKEDPKSQESLNFTFNAAVLYEALGSTTEALNAYGDYTRRAKRNSEKAEAFWAMAEIYRKSNRLSLASQTYQDYLSVAPLDVRAVEAAFHVHQISKRLNRITIGKEWRAKVLNMQRRVTKPGAAKFAARIKYEDTLETFNEFKRIRIPQDPKRQKAALDQKIDYLKRVTTEVQNVIKFDSAEEIVDSLVLLGDSNQHMYDAIVQVPVPKGLNADEAKQYTEGVQNLAKPFQDQAREAYRTAVSRARELETYSPKYHDAYLRNLQLNPPAEGQAYTDGYGEAGLETYYLNWTVK